MTLPARQNACCAHPKSAHRGQYGEPHAGHCKRCECKGSQFKGTCGNCGGDLFVVPVCMRCTYEAFSGVSK